MSNTQNLAPAAAGALSNSHAVAVLVLLLITAEREHSRGDAGETARTALTLGGLYSSEIASAARRARRRVPTMSDDMTALPAVLELGRRLAAAERVGGVA